MSLDVPQNDEFLIVQKSGDKKNCVIYMQKMKLVKYLSFYS